MYDPADVHEPNECELCGNHVDAHDHYCPFNDDQGRVSDLETDLDPDAADWALASAIVDFELTDNAAYWAARRVTQ